MRSEFSLFACSIDANNARSVALEVAVSGIDLADSDAHHVRSCLIRVIKRNSALV